MGADEAETVVATTTNSEVNVLATQLVHDVFGVARAFPAIDQPSRGANAQLLARIGGRVAFGRSLEVRDWEYALDRGDARVLMCELPEHWRGRTLEDAALPESVMALARLHRGSVEIAHPGQPWERGDRIVLLSRDPHEAIQALLADVVVSNSAHS